MCENSLLKICGLNIVNISLQVYRDPMKRLELKFRPQDTFCKAACGDRSASHKLLLKVKRKPKDTKGQEGEDTSDEVSAEIVGIAESVYRFDCKC